MKKELSNYGMAAKLKLSMDKDDPDDLELTTECIKEQLLKRSIITHLVIWIIDFI